MKLLVMFFVLATSACAVVHQASNGAAYGVFTGGLFDWSAIIFSH
ncbi:hypothetical protein [Simonsiella muelleri]|nr:hypothetical protein [Simonsiella muelleri]